MFRAGALVTLGVLVASSFGVPRSSSGVEEEILAADRAFAAGAAESGIEGWMSFMAADAARMPTFGGAIVSGLDAIRAADEPLLNSRELQLQWEPVRAYAFDDARHGVTTGTYRLVRRSDGAEVGAGRYLTFWRREGDGWKVIFDTGVPEPERPAGA